MNYGLMLLMEEHKKLEALVLEIKEKLNQENEETEKSILQHDLEIAEKQFGDVSSMIKVGEVYLSHL